jgi:hypothetical protein
MIAKAKKLSHKNVKVIFSTEIASSQMKSKNLNEKLVAALQQKKKQWKPSKTKI